jgi:membrane-associated phospholipid phosphatase
MKEMSPINVHPLLVKLVPFSSGFSFPSLTRTRGLSFVVPSYVLFLSLIAVFVYFSALAQTRIQFPVHQFLMVEGVASLLHASWAERNSSQTPILLLFGR